MAATLSIGEVARRTGTRPSALRYYEEAGILRAPARVGGKRRYEADVVRRVDLVRFAQQAGFSLDEVRTLFYGFAPDTPLSSRWRSLARKKMVQLDELAERVRRMRAALELSLKCGCVRVEECALSPTDASQSPRRRPHGRAAALELRTSSPRVRAISGDGADRWTNQPRSKRYDNSSLW
jgi:MerR family redox-sensitive transcriptional activator SoxR